MVLVLARRRGSARRRKSGRAHARPGNATLFARASICRAGRTHAGAETTSPSSGCLLQWGSLATSGTIAPEPGAESCRKGRSPAVRLVRTDPPCLLLTLALAPRRNSAHAPAPPSNVRHRSTGRQAASLATPPAAAPRLAAGRRAGGQPAHQFAVRRGRRSCDVILSFHVPGGCWRRAVRRRHVLVIAPSRCRVFARRSRLGLHGSIALARRDDGAWWTASIPLRRALDAGRGPHFLRAAAIALVHRRRDSGARWLSLAPPARGTSAFFTVFDPLIASTRRASCCGCERVFSRHLLRSGCRGGVGWIGLRSGRCWSPPACPAGATVTRAGRRARAWSESSREDAATHLPPGLRRDRHCVRPGPSRRPLWRRKTPLLHHLNLPRLWLEAGGLVDLVEEDISLYPSTWELLFGAGLVLGGAVGAKLLHFVCLPLRRRDPSGSPRGDTLALRRQPRPSLSS